MKSPTQRTLAAQASLGRVCEIVERYNYHVMRPDGGFGIRQDLFGFLDILALEPSFAVQPELKDLVAYHRDQTGAQHKRWADLLEMCIPASSGIIGIQSCGQDWSGHVKKLSVERKDIVTLWLKANATCELWAWRKVKVKRGGKQMVWRPRIGDVILTGDGVQVVERSPKQ